MEKEITLKIQEKNLKIAQEYAAKMDISLDSLVNEDFRLMQFRGAPSKEEEMSARAFVEEFRILQDDLLKSAFGSSQKSAVASEIMKMDLNLTQQIQLKEVLKGLLTDTLYSVLLGLDGSAQIGKKQITYKIYDQAGNLLSRCGNIEALAYEYFHERK